MAPGQSDAIAGELRLARDLLTGGQTARARAICEDAVRRQPGNIDAIYLLALVHAREGDLGQAARLFDRAAILRPGFVDADYNCACAWIGLKRFEKALARLDRVVSLKPDHLDAWINRGNILRELKQGEAALASYDRALALAPRSEWLLNNRAVVLGELRRFEESLGACAAALSVNPRNAEALANNAITLDRLGRFDEALEGFARAAELKPDRGDIRYNHGLTLVHMKRHDEALEKFTEAIGLDPAIDYLRGTWLHAKMNVCDWSDFEADLKGLTADIERSRLASSPFPALALLDSPRLQKALATACAAKLFPARPPRPAPARRRRDAKIRVGYFSADFREHPMPRLMAGVFERHDRSRFETVGFSFAAAPGDATQARLAAAFDEFIDVTDMPDAAVASLARAKNIDIAVDLMGFTQQGRPGVFAARAAPAQASFLGYPATTGCDFIDYLIADEIVIPPSERSFYTEKLVTLPGCYYPSSYRDLADYAAPAPARGAGRRERGLPETGFVFCCFNNNYKITPEVFASWMAILDAVGNSVLWLLADNETAAANLRKEAAARGVDPARLVFADRAPLADHMARHDLADLFLDTLPYNAHTTACDALWRGLPVLTRRGASFAGRVGASLLTAAGLRELVTDSIREYEETAIRLAARPDELSAIRAKTMALRDHSPLFDTEAFTRALEAGFAAIHARRMASREPADMKIPRPG